jgi:DNA-binding transcriptional ArsR family regulator
VTPARERRPRARATPRDDQVVLTDVGAIKALAHPARSRVIDHLYQGNVATSSELAALTGLTPSAMSYHLRALQKWGIVLRAEASDDGRERPWRAAGRGLSWSGRGGDATSRRATDAAMDVITDEYLDRLRTDLAAWRAVEDDVPGWDDTMTLNRGFPWLTAAESRRLATEVGALVERLIGVRTAADHPADARRVAYFFATAPVAAEFDRPAGDRPEDANRA